MTEFDPDLPSPDQPSGLSIPFDGKQERMKNLKTFGTPEGNKNQSQNVKGGNKPYSIRGSIKYLAGQQIDISNPKSINELLPAKPTIAQYIAMNTLLKASKADMKAVEFATDQIDGKLANTNINADLSAILNMSDEQLTEFISTTEQLNTASEASDSEV